MKNASRVLGEARQKADLVGSWADFSNALFNPVDGIITKAYPTKAEREAFFQTEQYKSIRHLLHEAIEKFGLVEGATPKKSGASLSDSLNRFTSPSNAKRSEKGSA